MSEILKKIYFDHNATTPLDESLVKALPEMIQEFGNPSSIHWASRGPKKYLRDARESVAKFLNVSPLEIIFTSGGSESNSTVFRGVFDLTKGTARNEFIISQIEHPSVLKAAENLESKGAKIHRLKVDKEGQFDLSFYKSVLSEKTALVSVMLANNETGVLSPISEMVNLAHEVGALFHTDAVQALGKVPLDISALGVDFASFSGHKFYSLKGSGVLFCKKGFTLPSLISGGGQERHRRGGTENTVGIAALGFVVQKYFSEVEERAKKILELRQHLQSRIENEISDIRVIGKFQNRIPNTLGLLIEDIDGETLLMSLDLKGFAVSTGAACSSGNPEPSHVLLAMGYLRGEAQKNLRISLGFSNTLEQVNEFVDCLKDTVIRLREIEKNMKAAEL